MDSVFDLLSWWQLPLSALGSSLTTILASGFGLSVLLGIFVYIIHCL